MSNNDVLGKGPLFFGQTKRVAHWHLPINEATGWWFENWQDNSIEIFVRTPHETVSSLVSVSRAMLLADQFEAAEIESLSFNERENTNGK